VTATSLVRTTATLVIFAVGTAAAVAGLLRQPTSGLVIITLDTTRADRLPAYGFGGVATPAIDALAPVLSVMSDRGDWVHRDYEKVMKWMEQSTAYAQDLEKRLAALGHPVRRRGLKAWLKLPLIRLGLLK